jgi:hypothetical protein
VVAQPPSSRPFDPLVWLTRLVLSLLVLTIALDFVAIVSDVSYHRLIERVANNGDVSLTQAQSADDRQNTIGYVQFGVVVVGAIFFINWFSRAYKNLGRLGVAGLRWREGWAIGAWFVPFLNLVRPKAIADDIWRGSDPDLPAPRVLPEDAPVPWYFDVWWALFIVYWILSRFAFQHARDADTLSSVSSATLLLVAADGLGVVSAAFAIAVVYRTVDRQRTRARVLANRASEDAPSPAGS